MAEASDSDWSADHNVATELQGPTEDGSDDSDNGQAAGAPLPGFVTTPAQCFGSDGRHLANPYNARALRRRDALRIPCLLTCAVRQLFHPTRRSLKRPRAPFPTTR